MADDDTEDRAAALNARVDRAVASDLAKSKTVTEFAARIDARIRTMESERDALIYKVVDHRIAKGDYQPAERERRFNELMAQMELVFQRVFEPDKKQH